MAIPSSSIWMTLPENSTASNHNAYNEPLLDPSNWVVALTLFTANLSIFSAGFLLFIFRCISRANNDLIICFIQCLAAVDILFCIGMDMGIAHYATTYRGTTDVLCRVQSFLCTFCDMVSYCYVSFIIIHLFSMDVMKSDWMTGENAKRIYHPIAWVIPAVITISAASTGALGDAKSRFGSWCWIEDAIPNKDRILWMLFTKQIWEILIYVLSAFLIILTVWLTKRKRRMKAQSRINQYQSPSEDANAEASGTNYRRTNPHFNIMVWLLLYFYFTRIWGTTRNMVRIVGLALGDDTVPGFKTLDEKFFIHAQSVGDSLQGTMNFLMFCYCDEKVWRQVKAKMCCWKQDSDMESDSIPILDNNIGNKRYD